MNATATASLFISQGITPKITDEGLGYLLAASEETIHLDLDAVRDAMWDQVDTLSAELFHDEWAVVDSRGGIWHPSESASSEIEASTDPAAEAIRICREAPFKGEWLA